MNGYEISTDPGRLDLDVIHGFLSQAYWSPGRGLAAWLMRTLLDHPDLQELRRTVLATQDAHGLYAELGFGPLARPERWMERPGVRPLTDPPPARP